MEQPHLQQEFCVRVVRGNMPNACLMLPRDVSAVAAAMEGYDGSTRRRWI